MIVGHVQMREDLLRSVEEQHDALAWHQGGGDLAKTVEDIAWAPNAGALKG